MIGQMLQFAGSLIAILALAWFARRLDLGGDTRIRDEAHLRELAEEALCGFEPVEIAIDRVGTGEKRFGSITLDLGDKAPAWAASLRRL
jgi:hypothetical protein